MLSFKNTSYTPDSLSTKEVLGYVLLALYLLAMFKPLVPYAVDMLAHSFWKSSHIKNVHQHHGSQHVHSEIVQSEHDDNDKSQKAAIKVIDPVAIHIWSKFSYNFLITSFKQQDDYPYLFFVLTPHSDVSYPPPKS